MSPRQFHFLAKSDLMDTSSNEDEKIGSQFDRDEFIRDRIAKITAPSLEQMNSSMTSNNNQFIQEKNLESNIYGIFYEAQTNYQLNFGTHSSLKTPSPGPLTDAEFLGHIACSVLNKSPFQQIARSPEPVQEAMILNELLAAPTPMVDSLLHRPDDEQDWESISASDEIINTKVKEVQEKDQGLDHSPKSPRLQELMNKFFNRTGTTPIPRSPSIRPDQSSFPMPGPSTMGNSFPTHIQQQMIFSSSQTEQVQATSYVSNNISMLGQNMSNWDGQFLHTEYQSTMYNTQSIQPDLVPQSFQDPNMPMMNAPNLPQTQPIPAIILSSIA
uniref:Uncharacterized protein n=1 Tax=Acrobeloides nanus TaxID=290746 RepID=A0A914C2A7_9BILA